ncbi:MAG: RNA 2',3'-cyclic phosphodiesterase [Thermodesulfobacteriota bacterium]
MPRLFVAIDLPKAAKEELAGLAQGLPGVHWVETEQLHLTLRFVGEVDDPMFRALRARLAEIQAPAFSLGLTGLGTFPPRGTPRVLWVGLTPVPELFALQAQIEAMVQAGGLPAEERPFTPHITLARLRPEEGHGQPGRRERFRPPRRERSRTAELVARLLARHQAFGSPPFPVAELHLYSSLLTPRGALHRREASYPLAEPPSSPETG